MYFHVLLFFQIPTSPEEWLAKAQGFKFPHCVAALDGKHIKILCPPKSGSEFFNFKGGFSIVLLALVDSNYCFMFADIGSQGRISDGGVLRQSILWEKICNNRINFPPPSPLPGSNINFPYVILADGAFALHTNIMKPYPGNHEINTPQRIFNEKLSGSRVVVENVFGIMSEVFRVFGKPIAVDVEKASIITKTCVLLHNFLSKSKTSRDIYTPAGTVDTFVNEMLIRPGSWRQNQNNNGFLPLQQIPRRATGNAIQTRLNFTNYIHQTINE